MIDNIDLLFVFLIEEIGIKENVRKTIYSLELTDMWYKILADVDQPLQRAISKSKIRIGYKLEICGAKVFHNYF